MVTAVWYSRRITVRSSRSHFVARLNSGVRRVKARATADLGFGYIAWPFDPSCCGLRMAGFGRFFVRALRHHIGSLIGFGSRVRRVDAETLPAQWMGLRSVRR